MLDLMARVFFVKKVPLFARLDLQSLFGIARAMDEVALGPNEYYFRQGEPGDALYIMLDGEAEILLDEKPINKAIAGQSFGEIAVLDNSPRTAGVRTKTDSYALKISKDDFDQLFFEQSELRIAIIQELSARLIAIKKREEILQRQLAGGPGVS